MRLTKYFFPTLREMPQEAQIVSHKLMLRAGLITQSSAGIYSWLPMGLKVLNKIANIIKEEQNKVGHIEILMPTIQPATLWQESGRYEAYGKEMLRFLDRHEREMLYGPTNEELVTDIFRTFVKSYKNIPLTLYQIQWKFRDEIRPRFGVMRGREFYMKDGYSFDLDFEGAQRSYQTHYESYLRTFKRMGLTAIPVKADSGAIGGDMSHEFQILAQTGESTLYYDEELENLDHEELDIKRLQSLYAAAEEKHDSKTCPVPESKLKTAKGIEVGHIFYFGTKYSEAMNVSVMDGDGDQKLLHMGSYGIGVSRLVAAIIEASHDENGIIWPKSVAPFEVSLINLKAEDEVSTAVCEKFYEQCLEKKIDVLYDDRFERAGVKFADHDLIGVPWQVIVGPKNASAGRFEVKNRKTNERFELSQDDVFQLLTKA